MMSAILKKACGCPYPGGSWFSRPGLSAGVAALLLAAGAACTPAWAAVYRVDAASTAATPDGATWATAFKDIQSAVDAASAAGGAEVWVAAGTYTATTDPVLIMVAKVHLYGGFAGTESAREERDWANHETVIDGENTRRCIEGASDAALDGFSVTRGRSADGGGGMYNYWCSPTVTNCVFARNATANDGGGMCNDHYSSPTMTNCVFAQNTARFGGGMQNTYGAQPTMTNCTFAQNKALSGGGAIHSNSSYPAVANCIFWGDSGGEIGGGARTVVYSCIDGGYEGEGNIDADPLFWNAPDGDFRLHSSSPCLDSATPVGAPGADVRGVVRPQSAGIDRGAYEMHEPDTDGDGLMDEFERTYSHTDPADADSDDDGTDDWDAWFDDRVWCVDASSTAAAPDGLCWATAFPDIQSAVNGAYIRGGGEVWVAQGTYTGTGDNVVVMRPGVGLYGGFAGMEVARQERDWTHHESVIDGEDTRRCVLGANDTTLDGFTVTRGDSGYGGGMYNVAASPIVANCIFTANSASSGGGISNGSSSSPTVTHCTFTHNAASNGAGIYGYFCTLVVTDCAFSANAASNDGGGIYNSGRPLSAMVTNCTFSQNIADSGGGMCDAGSSAVVTNCTFSQNVADSGGGMYGTGSSAVVTNCTFAANTATLGAGMYNFSSSSSPTLMNCTFAENSATSGGGIYNQSSSSLTVTNCILWGDRGGEIYGGTPTVTFSCIEGGCAGEGNIDANPLFWNALDGDLRLHVSSPCGDSGTATGAPNADIRGLSRPQGAGIDRGAYEMNELDADGDGLMDEFETTYSHTDPNDADSDDDGVDDREAWFSFRVWYVDAASTSGAPDGAAWATAFPSIQTAVNWAYSTGGGEIWVVRGTYTSPGDEVVTMRPNVHLYGGFAGTESAREERNWSNHETTIDGEDARCCVTGADNATLDGFIVTRGTSTYGGGMYNEFSSPTVTNCTFARNAAFSGGGMYNKSSSPEVTNCTFTRNTAQYGGGGMFDASSSSPTVTNCAFTLNTAKYGAGMYDDLSSTVMMNCTFALNAAQSGAGGIDGSWHSSLTAMNCILWDNMGGEIGGNTAIITYSCVEGGYTGEGNTDADPVFWHAAEGDFRLHSSSSCIDSGSSADAPAVDIRGVPRPQGAGVDRGAYEMYEPDTDGDGLMDDFETTYAHTDPADADSDDDGTNDGDAWFTARVWHVDAASIAGSPDGAGWDTAFADIQTAVDWAYATGGGEIRVAKGAYVGAEDNVVVMRRNVYIYGGFAGTETTREERDWANHETVIDGEGVRRGVFGASDAVLDGFTVTRGEASNGGGMHNCYASPTIANCTFAANAASTGGGMYNGHASPTVTNCTFAANIATDEGGGMCNNSSSPTVTNCRFSMNSASEGGGMHNYYMLPTIANCIFAANTASDHGGGMYNNHSSPTVRNCTCTANTAVYGGGIYNDGGTLTATNSIFWGDVGGEIVGSSARITYSCIEAGYWGEGNIDAHPLFWQPLEGDFRLHPSSPCMDTGTSAEAPNADIRGVVRPQGTGVDRGAYEMDEPDGDGDGLMDEFETAYSHTDPNTADSDEDGIDDGETWLGIRVWRVDAASTAIAPDGLAWATAFPDIQTPLDRAYLAGGGELWVAQGDYTGDSGQVVMMRYNVHLYGGFAGTEDSREERDWTNHDSVVDGEDVRRCVTGANRATLDGFTLTSGRNSNGGGMDNDHVSPAVMNCLFTHNTASKAGGGMRNYYSSPAIADCTFAENTASTGGGMANSAFSSPTVTNCILTLNSASSFGGGVCNGDFAQPTISDCTFAENTALYGGGVGDYSLATATLTDCMFAANAAAVAGGGIYCIQSASPCVVNSTFVQNTASEEGGGICCDGYSAPTISNCTFTANDALSGGGMYCSDQSWPTILNCILWGNASGEVFGGTSVVAYSCVEGGCAGEGNTDADPLLGPLGEEGGSVRTCPINVSSSARDTGVRCFLDETGVFFYELPGGNGYVLSDGMAYVPWSIEHELTATDARGVTRPQGSRVDMGAYEFAIEDLHAADVNGDGTVSATEIGRVVGFYNASGYHVDGATADGYAPGAGSQEGLPHDSDYSPQDWTISAIELGRLVTLYNAGGYIRDSGTADGFAPVTTGE